MRSVIVVKEIFIFQYSSSLFLKACFDGAVKTSSGRLFHMFTVRSELLCCGYIFSEFPLFPRRCEMLNTVV